mmetsp:Transcript_20970/g.35796  ORF Transcript_20970/g.35796 Transcript_20970/m.35796 type:complete len:101 (-) Transcript_20970:532-834(-)
MLNGLPTYMNPLFSTTQHPLLHTMAQCRLSDTVHTLDCPSIVQQCLIPSSESPVTRTTQHCTCHSPDLDNRVSPRSSHHSHHEEQASTIITTTTTAPAIR